MTAMSSIAWWVLPVVIGEQPRVGAADHDRQPGLGDRDADLVGRAAGGEGREGVGERHEAHGGQPRGDAGHVGLGDAYLEETLGEGRGEEVHLRGGGEVGVQADDALVALSERNERLAVGFAHGDQRLHERAPVWVASSARACSLSSSETSAECHRCVFSMNETPLPLIV